MSSNSNSQFFAHVDIDGHPVLVGTAHVLHRRNVVSITFDYDNGFQALPRAYALGPDLPLTTTKNTTIGLPKAFADSAPDRWGRNLIRKRLQQAQRTNRVLRSFHDVDFLLGVSDATRQGALRFSLSIDGPYQADDIVSGGIPRLIELPRLLAAADEVARDPDDMSAIKVLLDAGSGTLGGARPKASARDEDRLLIAKFPHHQDDWDVMVWEKTALDLAELSGIDTPTADLTTISERHVLLVERFDRQRDLRDDANHDLGGHRIPYVSAMTLIDAADGEQSDYLELAEAIQDQGAAVTIDLAQLWRRIAFSIIINNTDDHMRNHGFLRERGGWRLSPAFDLNPEPDVTRRRASTIGFTSDPAQAKSALFGIAGEFTLPSNAADEIWDELISATANWRDVAASNGASDREVALFGSAFDRYR